MKDKKCSQTPGKDKKEKRESRKSSKKVKSSEKHSKSDRQEELSAQTSGESTSEKSSEGFLEPTKASSELSINEPSNESSDSESDSESEEEDVIGELVTDEIDQGINSVLDAIRNDSAKLLDPTVKFYPNIEQGLTSSRAPKKKPMYLKDYHRETLLQGADEEIPKATYNEELDEIKADFLAQSSMGDDDDNDEFLEKRKEERHIPDEPLPDPDKDAKGFLEAFISKKGWIPKDTDEITGDKKVPHYGAIVEEDSDGFDDIADKFESAYNFRYEDPEANEIVSYARDQNTMRRREDKGRRSKREKKKEAKAQAEQERKAGLAQLKKAKVSEITDKLEKLAGARDSEELSQFLNEHGLDGEWDASEWDARMQELFDNEESAEYLASRPKAALKRTAREFVEANADLLLGDAQPASDFRYREVEPESFGLSTMDILLADDKDLNEYVSLKKLATFRDPEKRNREKKQYNKKKRLREWRESVFGSEEGGTNELWEKLKEEAVAAQPEKPRRRKARKS